MRKPPSWCPELQILIVFFLMVSCGENPTGPSPPTCTFTLSTSSLSFGAAGGTATVGIDTGSTCPWTSTSDHEWMTITSGASGTGAGSVVVTVHPNTSLAERTGTLSIEHKAVSVRQDAAPACKIELSPTSASFGKDSDTANFTVNAGDQCSWSATSNASWLTIVSGTTGTGHGTVAYAVERNRDDTSRSGTIAVGDQLFTVTQAADTGRAPVCEYSVQPVFFAPCMTAPSMSATVTTSKNCTWTAEAGAPWVTVTSPRSGTGSGVISFTVTNNWDAPRRGVVNVRWPTVTAGQNLQIAQAGCTYGVSPTEVSIAVAGGPGRFDVVQESDPQSCGGALQDRCMWVAKSDVSWIVVTTPMPQFGDNPVGFSVAPNEGGVGRTGVISVRNRTVVVMQAGK